MALRVVGAGLGRTGTMSLKLGLERLLGGPCYHMIEVFQHPEHVALWHQASLGRMPDWEALFEGYVAAVDWPVCSFWEEVGEAFPDAPVLLSVRDPESWWRSASNTIFPSSRRAEGEWREMVEDLFANRFTREIDDKAKAIAAYEAHYAKVRREVPASRLLEWRATDGWGPLCDALGVPVPDEPFPHANTTAEFQARVVEVRGGEGE